MLGCSLSLSRILKYSSADQPTFSPTQIFKIVCSLPLLQDLDIMSRGIPNNDRSVIFQPAVSPPLTGTFSICLAQGIGQTMRVLLDLPNSVRFRKLLGTARLEEDLWWIAALVAVCSDTLEYIYVRCLQPRKFLLLWLKNVRLECRFRAATFVGGFNTLVWGDKR